MASLFLSYDHDDVGRAAPIASALEKAGHSVWWDRHISGGAQYNDEIEAAVEKADAVVVLWSKRSVRSAWVRDEAAEGRDQGKLVPVLIDAIKPPMGFRQFQTIDLSRSGRGLGGASLQQLLDAIDALGGISRAPMPTAAASSKWFDWTGWRTGFVAGLIALIATVALLAWTWRGQPALAVVAVTASDTTPRSQALSSDLNVKLGTLAHVGGSKWQLADPQSPPSITDLVFRVAGTGTVAQPQANLVLLDGKRKGVLWSREFTQPNVTEADLRLQLSLTAGQVLSCALEAHEAGGLRPDLLKLFLAGCADAAETSKIEPHKIARVMRTIVNQQPRFKPAWAQLLIADTDSAGADAEGILAADMKRARTFVPDLVELKIIEIAMKPRAPFDHADFLDRSTQMKALAPDMALLWGDEARLLSRVGRMRDAVESARRAVELDPLNPGAATDLIYALAYGGQIELAREELRKAERQWPGTGALRDAQWGFHLRYGDPRIAMTLYPSRNFDASLYVDKYLRARLEPTPANVDSLVADVQRSLSQSDFEGFGYAIQALGEFHKTKEAFAWFNRTPPAKVDEASAVLFRPGLAEVRRDPRFMAVAKRIGLLAYWQKSGEWPDFCFEPDLPYDCKEEAAKLAA